MKKMKKFVLSSEICLLTNSEQLNVVGGNASTTGCSGLSYDQCGGTCYDSAGYQGYCGWVKKNSARCACGIAYVDL